MQWKEVVAIINVYFPNTITNRGCQWAHELPNAIDHNMTPFDLYC